MFALLVLVLIAGGALAAGTILSKIPEYPGSVANQMVVSAPFLGANETPLTGYVGIRQNVSIVVRENGYAGPAHAVYEVHATSITCSDVTMSGFYGDTASCTPGRDLITFDANSKTFVGGSMPWWFNMTMNRVFASVTLRIYVVQG